MRLRSATRSNTGIPNTAAAQTPKPMLRENRSSPGTASTKTRQAITNPQYKATITPATAFGLREAIQSSGLHLLLNERLELAPEMRRNARLESRRLAFVAALHDLRYFVQARHH